MPKSKLSKEERQGLFAEITIAFEDRDRGFAWEIQHFINGILNNTELSNDEAKILANQALNFAAELSVVLKPYQHSLDWMTYAARLIDVMVHGAKVARQYAIDAGVNIEDPEEIRDLCQSAEIVDTSNENPATWVENTSKLKH